SRAAHVGRGDRARRPRPRGARGRAHPPRAVPARDRPSPGAAGMSAPRVAYVLRAFPRLSETFILQELLALRARGEETRIFALERVEDGRMLPEAERLLPEVTFVETREPAAWSGPALVPAKQRRWAAAGRRIGLELEAWRATHVHAHFAGPAATA